MVFMICCTVISRLFPEDLISIFSNDPDVIHFGVIYLSIFSLGYAAVGTMFALFHRTMSGVGQHVDISIQEACSPYTGETAGPMRWYLNGTEVMRSGAKPLVPAWGPYECRDGWVIIANIEEPQWDGTAQLAYETTGDDAILNPDFRGRLYARIGHVEVLEALLYEFTHKLTKDELMEGGQKKGSPILKVSTTEEVVDSPHLNARDFFVHAKHPVVGGIKYPGGPYRFIGDPGLWGIRDAAPLLGEHNDAIYCQELGFSKEDLALMKSSGAI